MRNFISQFSQYVIDVFSSVYRYFTPTSPELGRAELINPAQLYIDPRHFAPMQINPQIVENILSESTARMHQTLLRDIVDRINLTPPLPDFVPYRAPTLFEQFAARHGAHEVAFMRRQQAHAPRPQGAGDGRRTERASQQADNPLSFWWKQFRLGRRNAQFDMALTLPEDELYAAKLENLPDVNIPEDFLCGISSDIMTNPVYDPNHPQQKYDLLVLEAWVHLHETNPCTREPLFTENLVYDENLKARIDKFMTETLSAQRLQFS